ncbi:MAG: aminopeptidase P N-terminal domain-containing protein [Deltaproteobacteria bacterium]|nr:aminopeptidase P N-terminal domain-containing protein [Deltaproteobacteria bacterium]
MFAERRQRMHGAMGDGAIAILIGAKLVTRSADTEFPFRQDSDFWYLTGYAHPNAVAVLRTDGGPAYTLYVEPRDPARETWTGHRPGTEGAVAKYGADEAHERERFLRDLPELVAAARRIFHVLGRSVEIDRCITESIENLRLRSRQGVEPPEAIVDPRSIVHEMRLIKTAAELELMRRGAAISAEAHAAAAALAHPGRSEYELEAALEYTFRRRGASGPAYTTIVGGAHNAAVLHYIKNDCALASDSLVLIDAGCEFEGYASDVTRTYPVGGGFTGARRDVYEIVLAAQLAALDACRPGNTLPQIHDAAVKQLVEGLIALDVLSGDADELIKNERHRPYYMHGTSHWLGLDTHDAGSYRKDGAPRVLEPGTVFTVEPGLYFGEAVEDIDERLRGIGVRIEDNVVITADGHENLNSAIPKLPDDVEALVSQR